MMERTHLLPTCLFAMKKTHEVDKSIICDKTMRHFNPLSFHWMVFTEMIVSNSIIV